MTAATRSAPATAPSPARTVAATPTPVAQTPCHPDDLELRAFEMFETLAGRLEYDDGMSREDAERQAHTILDRPQA